MNAEQASKDKIAGADLSVFQGRPPLTGEEATNAPGQSRLISGIGMSVAGKSIGTREAPTVGGVSLNQNSVRSRLGRMVWRTGS